MLLSPSRMHVVNGSHSQLNLENRRSERQQKSETDREGARARARKTEKTGDVQSLEEKLNSQHLHLKVIVM